MKPNETTPIAAEDDEDLVDPMALERSLREMGQRARQEAFAAGLTVLVVRAGRLVKLYPDGRAEDVGAVTDTVLSEPK